MKILLLNDNPVVNKLVILSAQKTYDTLDIVESIEEITSEKYDLLVLDDAMYSEDMFAELQSKIQFSSSLYICLKSAPEVDNFTAILKKPFLPTDLVEYFLKLSREINYKQTREEPSLENTLSQNLDLDSKEDEYFSVGDEDFLGGESILDHKEAQEVKDLLDETSYTQTPDLEYEQQTYTEVNKEEEKDLEAQILDAIRELSEEDMESELDKETLLSVLPGENDSFASLNSNGLKLALNEAVEIQGIQALENLLETFKDKNMLASMKGQKFNISITIGAEQ